MIQTSRLLSIQYLRAFAAVMVVIYHAMRWTKPSFEIGAAGVDVFFIISGFILWTISRERPIGPRAFLVHRWKRVAPLYWVLTLVAAAIAWPWPKLIWDAHVTVGHLLLSLAFIQHLNPVGEPFPVITAGWSLNYEAVFYLIFAGALLAPERLRLRVLTLGLLAVPLFGIIVRPAYFLGANMMFLQFIAGIWLAEARLAGKLPKGGEGWIMAALALMAFAALIPFDLYDKLWRPILWGAPALLLVAGVVSLEGRKPFPDIGWLKLLGDASYSIYLTHVVVIQLMSHVLRDSHLTFAAVTIPLSIAAGLAVYFAIERPLMAALRSRKSAALPSPSV